jgi:tRNA(Arg) A34 adenosine deaminase TadA
MNKMVKIMNMKSIFICIIFSSNFLCSSISFSEIVIESAQHAAEIAVSKAEEAQQAGTFGVGGFIVDNQTKKILAIAQNAVVKEGITVDPTAHVERQLISWYFEQIEKGIVLPAPHNLTIVSSLDPCVMCAGCILVAGFHVYSVALDEPTGVTDCKGFLTLPESLRKKALNQFHLFGQKNDTGIFQNETITQELQDNSVQVLLKSLTTVREMIYGAQLNNQHIEFIT